MMGKSLKVNDFGGQWPQFCDHSVTSADVRQTVGNTHRRLLPQFSMRLDLKKKIVSSP